MTKSLTDLIVIICTFVVLVLNMVFLKDIGIALVDFAILVVFYLTRSGYFDRH